MALLKVATHVEKKAIFRGIALKEVCLVALTYVFEFQQMELFI